ncbi:hypothetical protein DES52_106136 [Deinococcus yavapaiensis KR-236]|uniref:Uncharacterized protein n=1 Tax=Deinococcus yavapaiensis KR-236 TaxID=694435 RepID=A0A318S778_9DEIO|nr:hypothetical protein DES52_106136 [Deinococcus yavapaiensis KR-236]
MSSEVPAQQVVAGGFDDVNGLAGTDPDPGTRRRAERRQRLAGYVRDLDPVAPSGLIGVDPAVQGVQAGEVVLGGVMRHDGEQIEVAAGRIEVAGDRRAVEAQPDQVTRKGLGKVVSEAVEDSLHFDAENPVRNHDARIRDEVESLGNRRVGHLLSLMRLGRRKKTASYTRPRTSAPSFNFRKSHKFHKPTLFASANACAAFVYPGPLVTTNA